MNKLISLKNVSKTYDNKTYVLNEVNLEVESGEFIAVRAKSGGGKSTLMNIIGLLDKPSGGTYMFEKIQIKNHGNYDSVRGNSISFIFQSYNLIEQYSVWDNVMMPFLYSSGGIHKNTIHDTMEILDRLNIAQLKNKKAVLLSGGEKQRVAIARALVKKPKLVIADEPTGNLDNENAAIINTMFKEIANNGTAVIVATHSDSLFMDVDTFYKIEQGMLI